MMNLFDTIDNIANVKYLGEVDDLDIVEAENKLGVYFASDYRAMIKHYGCVWSNKFNFTGIGNDEDTNVVNVTMIERLKNRLLDGSLYIIDNILSDNVRVAQDKSGDIYYVFDNMTPIKVCNGIIKYIEIREKAL